MMLKEHLVSMTELAEDLGTTRQVVAEIVKRLRITPKEMRQNGRAKGLDRLDVRRIRRVLGPAPTDAQPVESEE